MIKEIPEYQILLKEIEGYKKLLNQQRRAIKSVKERIQCLEKKYQFVFDIFSATIGDFELEDRIHLLLKNVGYQNVIHLKEDTRNPDIVIDYCNFKTVIEVKNTKNSSISENEMFQIVKYKNRYQDDFKNLIVRGILVLNHDNQLQPSERNKNPFDLYRHRDAILNSYSIVTTTELLSAFLLLQKEELTLQEFEKVVHSYGVVKFSKKFVKKCLSSL